MEQYDFKKIADRVRSERKNIFVKRGQSNQYERDSGGHIIFVRGQEFPCTDGYSQATQKDIVNIATDLGLHIGRNSLSDIENGVKDSSTLSIGELSTLCRIFGCEMGYLLCEEGYENKTRQTTDLVNALGLTNKAINKLKVWNTPTKVVGGNYEHSARLQTNTNNLTTISAVITDPVFMQALTNYLYAPGDISCVYTNSPKDGKHMSHDPALIVMDGVQITADLVNQATFNTLVDSIKALKKKLN